MSTYLQQPMLPGKSLWYIKRTYWVESILEFLHCILTKFIKIFRPPRICGPLQDKNFPAPPDVDFPKITSPFPPAARRVDHDIVITPAVVLSTYPILGLFEMLIKSVWAYNNQSINQINIYFFPKNTSQSLQIW